MQTIEEGPLTLPEQETVPAAEADAILDLDDPGEAALFAASAEQPLAELRVFISHKCDLEPDETIAARLHDDLKALGCEVYLDKAQPPGVRYDEAISNSLKNADFVVALISRHANESDWVKYELSFAAEGNRLHGRPTIIPVRLGFTEQYSAVIGASVGTINAVSCDPGDYAELLEGVKAGMGVGRRPWKPAQVVGMEAFLVKDFRKSLTRAAYFHSAALRRASGALQRERLLWIVGDASVRNYFARTLAVSEHDRELKGAAEREQGWNIYEVPRSLGCAKVDDTLVRHSFIILPDMTPSVLFDEEAQRDELKSLKNLVKRNTIIITASEVAYSEIEQEMRNRDFRCGAIERVGHDLYDEQAKLTIFERVLDFSHKSQVISQKQYQWGERLLEDAESGEIFRPILNKWAPADIERFITQHLRQAKRPDDILRLLQRNADLDNEIHTWFMALDGSTRCFVLALAMLSGLGRGQFWEKYKLVFQRLRELDASLSLRPLGICRRQAAPHVTTEGQYDFADERITEAVCREVTKNFREYLIELVPLMKEMSVPPGRDRRMTGAEIEARKLKAAESKQIRTALARLTGKAGRQGLEDLVDLLDFWATDPLFSVREAVALCLEQAVTERTGVRHALGLLERWSHDLYRGNEALYRAAAAASALGSIVAARTGREAYERALDLLRRLAGGSHVGIKFYVAIALKRAARRVPLVEKDAPISLAALLSLVARSGKAATKIIVAEALIEARIADEAAALSVIRKWAEDEDADCRWAAMCSLLLWRKQKQEERNREAVRFLKQDASMAAEVLVEILNHKHRKMPVFWQGFEQLVLEEHEETKRALVAGLIELPQSNLEETLLPLLRGSDKPALVSLVAEVRAERWRRMFATPLEFIADLLREVRQERLTGEVYRALALLLRPEPEGCRRELREALVSCFAERRASLEEIMKRLKRLAPPVFEPLSVEIRGEGLRALFENPPALVSVLAEGLRNTEVADETFEALELLAQPEPHGSRVEMLQSLTQAQALDAAPVRALLGQLRATGSSTLGNFAYEFTLRQLEGDLSNPERFLSRVVEAMKYAPDRAEVFQVLRNLSEYRRGALVRALGITSVTRPAEVNVLLQEPAWQTRAGLFSLGTEIKLFSFLANIFSPTITSKLFDLMR